MLPGVSASTDDQHWDGLDAERVAHEPWWALWVPEADPDQDARAAALAARPGYDLDPESHVADGAHVVASRFRLGPRSYVAAGCRLRGEVSVGSDSSLNVGVVTIGKVTIGDGVRIAPYVVLVGESHVFADPDVPIHKQGLTSTGVIVEDDVWVGANATVVDGVTIGAHSVVGAGAVVTRSVPPHSVVGGVPARVLRSRLDPPVVGTGSPRRRSGDALTRFDTAVGEQWPDVVDRCRTEVDGRVCWSEEPGGDPLDPRPLNDAVEIAGMFGALPPGATRDELVARIQASQDPATGLFTDPRYGPPKVPLRPSLREWEMYGIESCGSALEVVGAAPAHPVHVVERCGADELQGWLDQLDLGLFAWPSGSWIDAYATAVHLNRAHHGSTDTAPLLWGWLLTRQDPASGMWGTYLRHDGHREWGWLMAVNGFYRLTRGTYAQFGVEVPRPEAAIDTVLAHARQWRWFADEERNACNLLDVVHPLWLLGHQTGHRRAEARDAVAALLPGLLADWVDGEGFAWDLRRGRPGLRGTEMLLSVVHTAAAVLDEAEGLCFVPRGIHRLAPAASVATGPVAAPAP